MGKIYTKKLNLLSNLIQRPEFGFQQMKCFNSLPFNCFPNVAITETNCIFHKYLKHWGNLKTDYVDLGPRISKYLNLNVHAYRTVYDEKLYLLFNKH